MELSISKQGKVLRSENYNYIFNSRTGFFVRWGKTADDDPQYSPFGPEILDLEISVGGDCMGNCPFCSPKGTLVNTLNGKISIEDIKEGDNVIGYDITSKRIKINVIEEVYEREFQGELICLELDNGEVLKVTPEHLIILDDGKEVKAENLKEKDLDKIIVF